MTDTDKPAPTEEQVKTANAAEEARWQDDFKEEDLSVPYKREAATTTADTNDKNKKEKDADDRSDDTDTTTDTDYLPGAAEQPAQLDDPGDYKPADYSFEVTLKDGKSVTVKSAEQADTIADDPDNFQTPKQLSDFLRKQMSMERKLERDKESWEQAKAAYDKQAQATKEQQETISSYAAEFNYLVSKGQLPKVSARYANADWTDPEIAKQPGVKEQLELLRYMVKENKVRTKAKVKPITSVVDAYNAWKLEAKADEAEQERKANGEARKAASSRVAGSSPSSSGVMAPKGIAVGNPNVFKRGAALWDN